LNNLENEKIELELLLQAIFIKYGYDFRDYAKASIKRRILRRLKMSELGTISEMQHRILNDKKFFEKLLLDLSINVTEMFRDPSFFRVFRQKIIPEIKNLPFIKIWHAGCATGEEVYSMAILLEEEGLYNQTQIYATDFNEKVLKKAKEGIYPVDKIKAYTRNYQSADGSGSFADFYTARYGFVVMSKSLQRNIVFADHNLVTDGPFGEMTIIICRNVLIYFNNKLQNKAVRLFRNSLQDGGFLCVGPKETIRFAEDSDYFEEADVSEKIYKKTESDKKNRG